VIYTTNAIESVNMSLRRITKNRSSFSCDEALLKLRYLALRNFSKKWTMSSRDWKAALTRFASSDEDRLPRQSPKPWVDKFLHTLRVGAIKKHTT